MTPAAPFDPAAALAASKHTFGEHGGVNMSIEASTTFTVMTAATMPEIFAGQRTADRDGCFLYARHFNPTVYTLGRELAALEDAEAGYCCASGMAAVSAALLQLADAGDHIVSSATVYGGTHALLRELLPQKTGITTTFVPIDDLAAVEAAFTPRTRVLYTETVSNPTLVVSDLAALAAIAHRHDAALVVDNTFCPVLITPTRFGADVVVHSLTKYINGASDLVAGAVVGRADFIARLMDLHTGTLMLLGPTMDPRAAFEVSMRLPHLPLRMAEHSRRALLFATRLAELGAPVVYPGLPTHPQHALMRRMLNPDHGFGGMLTLDLGTRDRAYRFMDILQNQHRFGFMAVSLGYAETLMSCSASSTSSELDDDALRAAGISPGLVRLSLGYTGAVEDRWQQLHAALVEVGTLDRQNIGTQANRTGTPS
ncbi:MAG: aminotransferase class V-fold PLP-dependent enzyme [Kofleriaceae bacterium]|nr:aminotransferase class V-fold PLP-dependent enzyme [Kofleriaceae bacterium]